MDEYMTTIEAADYLKKDPKTLMHWRSTGKGPTYFKLHRSVLYRMSDLDAYVEKGRVVAKQV